MMNYVIQLASCEASGTRLDVSTTTATRSRLSPRGGHRGGPRHTITRDRTTLDATEYAKKSSGWFETFSIYISRQEEAVLITSYTFVLRNFHIEHFIQQQIKLRYEGEQLRVHGCTFVHRLSCSDWTV